MKAFITNDDGIHSVGLLPIAHAALAAGYEVTLVAPATEHSATSASLTGKRSDDGDFVREQLRPEGLDERIEAYAVHASPALIVYGALLGHFGTVPDVVLSGVNYGPNVGPAVVHSGTVGAAFTAASLGVPALAASMGSMHPTHWETAQEVLEQNLTWFQDLPVDGRALNVNIPDVPMDQVQGIVEAPLSRFSPLTEYGSKQAQELLGFRVPESPAEWAQNFDPGTDVSLLAQGWATVSFVNGPTHASGTGELPLPVEFGN